MSVPPSDNPLSDTASSSASPEPTAADPRDPVTCSQCGTTAAQPPLTWVYETDRRRGGVWICDRCARTHLRSIEAKLDQEWW